MINDKLKYDESQILPIHQIQSLINNTCYTACSKAYIDSNLMFSFVYPCMCVCLQLPVCLSMYVCIEYVCMYIVCMFCASCPLLRNELWKSQRNAAILVLLISHTHDMSMTKA